MIEYNLWLDGASAAGAGIRFLSSLTLSEPVPRVTAYSIPGRNGDVHIYDGSFKNRTATIEGCLYKEDFVKTDFAKLNAWLFGTLGYRKLRTDDDPAHYLMARVTNGPEIAAKARKVAPFKIKFDCKPQRYLTSGDSSMTFSSSGGQFNSPSSFPAKPLLEITYNASESSARGAIDLNGVEISLDFLQVANYPKIIYDSETQVTYAVSSDSSKVVFDGIVRNGENIVIVPGTNVITTSGAVISVTITPRWWDL